MWVDDEDQLKPKLVIPKEAAEPVTLNKNLTELVLRQGHAVWVANQAAGGEAKKVSVTSPTPCVRRWCGRAATASDERSAPFTFTWNGRFRQSDFDFIIAVANLVVIALVRALAVSILAERFQATGAPSPGYDELIGESKPMQELKAKIESREPPGLRAGARRERLGQGTGGAGDPPRQPSGRSADDLGQLRGDSARPDGEPTLRPQGGGVHRRRPRSHRLTSSKATWARCFSTKSAS